jgi:AraC-like DNA-binding protein
MDVLLLRNEIVERTNLTTDNIFTVKFYPGGFEAVFEIEQRKIGSDIINLDVLISPSIIRKMKRLDCFNDRLTLIQNYFLTRLNRKFDDNYLYKKVVDTVSRYNLSGMSCHNSELATEMTLTDKTLYRYFKQLVGATPKEYFSIIRARSALTAYVADRKSFSVHDYGYYDNSHFYKDVFKFTGRKLSSYRPE